MAEIRKATQGWEAVAIGALYDEVCIALEKGENYPRWYLGDYPTLSVAEQALARGELYILWEGDEPAATVVLNTELSPAYLPVPWKIVAPKGAVLGIHTLVVSNRFQGRGFARQMIAFSEERGRAWGCKAVRLDTCETNTPALALYQSMGYQIAGQCDLKLGWEEHHFYVCLEKAL